DRGGGAGRERTLRRHHRGLLGPQPERGRGHVLRAEDAGQATYGGQPVVTESVVVPLTIEPGADNDPVFVGIGEIPSGRYPDRTFVQSLTQVAVRALRDASMRPDDIDTILLIPNLHSFDQQADLVFSRMVEELGLNRRAKASFMLHSGGSTSDNAVRVASGLISSGHARNVLVLQAEC